MLAGGGQLHKLDRHARRRPAGMGVEHMGRQAAMHLEPIGGRNPLIEAKRGDAENFPERRFGLGRRAVLHAALELPQDRVPAVPPHADDERDAKFFPIGVVEAVELGKLRVRQAIETDAGLFGRGLVGHHAGTRCLAREVGMPLDQCQPLIGWRGAYRRHHCVMQGGKRAERPLSIYGLRHPRRVLVMSPSAAVNRALSDALRLSSDTLFMTTLI